MMSVQPILKIIHYSVFCFGPAGSPKKPTSGGSPTVSSAAGAPEATSFQTPVKKSAGDERSASPAPASSSSVGNVGTKRPYDAVVAEMAAPAAAEPAQPRHRCPGCGLEGPVGTVGHQTALGVLEALWGRHSCGSSWMVTSVPRGFAAGGLINVWIPRNMQQCGPDAHPVHAAAASSGAPLPRCTSCGFVLRDLLLGATGDPNKWVAYLRCDGCGLALFGSMTSEGPFVHFCLRGRRSDAV